MKKTCLQLPYDEAVGSVYKDKWVKAMNEEMESGRSTTGYTLLVLGNLVSWKSQLQPVVALSTTEAELIALTEGVKESI